MTKTVLLLGRTGVVAEEVRRQLNIPNIKLLAGTGIDDVRSAFAATTIDHVIMGAGIDLEVRLAIVREVFQASDVTSVHLKDRASGPHGFMPFVRAVLAGLANS